VLIAAVVVARRPSVSTAAFAFYTWGPLPSFRFITLFSWLPDPVYAVVATVLEALVASFPVVLLLVFVTRFPAEPSSPSGRLRMRVADAALFIGLAICVTFAVFEPVRHHTWSNLANLIGIAVVAAGGVLAALQYREASGEDRRRIGWVLVGYGVTITSFVATNALITAPVMGSAELQAAAQLADIALPLALAYAILRHRVLDIGFVLNRTVVYAAVTSVVVVGVRRSARRARAPRRRREAARGGSFHRIDESARLTPLGRTEWSRPNRAAWSGIQSILPGTAWKPPSSTVHGSMLIVVKRCIGVHGSSAMRASIVSNQVLE
jgi:hypothetical protein